MHRIDQQKLSAAAQRWKPGFAHLPHPLLVVLVGGNSSCSQFTTAGLRYLARSAKTIAILKNGSLLVTTSARSPKDTLAVMKKEINVPALLFDYNDRHTANPYYGFLALADSFIVTAESISMLTESCAIGKPVYLYDASRPEHAGEPSEPNFITIEPRHAVTPLVMDELPFDIQRMQDTSRLPYHVRIPRHTRVLSRLGWLLRRFQGKLLSLLRLIKATFTFQGGIDYIAWKLERHTGVPIEVTPKMRRHPLLHSWGLVWRLYRRGVFR